MARIAAPAREKMVQCPKCDRTIGYYIREIENHSPKKEGPSSKRDQRIGIICPSGDCKKFISKDYLLNSNHGI